MKDNSMIVTVTPFTLNETSLYGDPMATLARGGRHIVQAVSGYDERESFTVDVAEQHDACEEAWKRYQNIDESRRTPDGGRSLMTGDMMRVVDEAQTATWWICCSIGWEQTREPGAERVEINKQAGTR